MALPTGKYKAPVAPAKWKPTPAAPSKSYTKPVAKTKPYVPGTKAKSYVPKAAYAPSTGKFKSLIPPSVYTPPPKPAPTGSYDSGGKTSYSPSGPVGSGSSVGGDVGGVPTGPVGSTALSNPVTVGGPTPSQVAALVLSNRAGSGDAAGFARQRNRGGPGYGLSLTPEQLRNIAARRAGG